VVWITKSEFDREAPMLQFPERFVLGCLLSLFGFILPVHAQSGYKSFAPAGSGPFPAVVFVSGCSGFKPFGNVNMYDEKAEQLRREGYLVIFVDYLGRRGLANCAGKTIFDDAGKDVLEAARWLRSQPNVDRARINVIGWSYGGGVVLAALRQLAATESAFHRAVLLYPDCRPLQSIKARVPVLALFAGQDDVAPVAKCAPLATALPAGTFRHVTYESARHGFDARGLPAKTQYAYGTIGYDAQADRAAWAEISAFLK
jgi:dienelactone hydrolase